MQGGEPPIPSPGNLRVLQVSYWLCRDGGGGIQTYLATLSQALTARDAGVILEYAALMPGAAPAYLPPLQHQRVYTGTEGAGKVGNMRRLWRWLNGCLPGVDVVHIHGVLGANFALAALACRRAGVPYVVSTHGSLAPEFLRPRGWKASIYLGLAGKRLLRGAAGLVATSEREVEVIAAFDSGLPIRVIPPGIEVGELPDRTPEKGCDLRVAFVGRLAPIKAVPNLIAAIAQLRAQGLDARLDIVGDGEARYLEELRADIAHRQLESAVTLHGYLSGADKLRVLRGADVFAMASHSESFGFAAVEALAQGVPVVVSAAVGLAPTVAGQDCGTVVPAGDVAALARGLSIYQDSAVREHKSRRAYACAREQFSLTAMGEQLASLYRSAAAGAW